MKQVRIYQHFKALPAAYDELLRAGAAHSFFLDRDWLENLIHAGMEGDPVPRIYGIEQEGDGALLALPMCHAARASMFMPRRLIGIANYYSSLFGPALRGDWRQDAGQRETALRLLAEAMANDTPAWDVMDLHPLDREAPLFDALVGAFRAAGMAVQPYFCFGNWYLDVNGRSYQDYFASLPSKLRNTISRKSAQLEKAGRLRVSIVQQSDDLDPAIAAYDAIYRASWKSAEPHPDFMASLITLCARRGWLRLGIAHVDDVPAAAQLWIVHDRRAHIYKLAYDERFAGLSVGSILTSRLMRHALDTDRVLEVDYLTGDEPYKRDWMSHRRERWGISVFNLKTLKGKLAACRHLGGSAVKKFFKPSSASSSTSIPSRATSS